jgi:flagellar biosynthetic protein FliR
MMLTANTLALDTDPLWIFFLVASRLLALFYLMPGIGTDQVPEQFRYYTVVLIAAICAMSLPAQPMPEELHLVLLFLGSEFTVGVLLSLFPSIILGSLSVSGQIIAGVIGLGQANMIDRSLGESVSVLAKFNILLGTLIFLGMNGHHVLLKACTFHVGQIVLGGNFSLERGVELLSQCFSSSFELSIVLSAPILIATLISQFLLGLMTKFVPQMNIFIISLPLSILMGFYMIGFTLDPLIGNIEKEFSTLEELSGAIFLP